MAFTIQHIRSDELERRPKPEDLVEGQLAINYNAYGGGIYFKANDGTLIKAGPVQISGQEPTPTNYTPFIIGEMWLDMGSFSNPILKIWDGMEWLSTNQPLDAVPGSVAPAEDCIYDLGTVDRRWGNIFTCDINMSNEGGSNDVDGTWGSYVIQEGEDDLFLINKRSGKKFKFMLQEVEQ